MKVSCKHYDQNLLLMVHHELPLHTWLLTRLHLMTCSSCRQRLAHYESLSAAMAEAIHHGETGVSMAKAPHRGAHANLKPVHAAALLLLAALAIAASYWYGTREEGPAEDIPPVAPIKHGKVGETPMSKPKGEVPR